MVLKALFAQRILIIVCLYDVLLSDNVLIARFFFVCYRPIYAYLLSSVIVITLYCMNLNKYINNLYRVCDQFRPRSESESER